MGEALSEHVAENRRYWDGMAHEWVVSGEQRWAGEARWGMWAIPNADLPLLSEEMQGLRAIELGCGTGYVSAWMRRLGASVYAIDNSEVQLATARRLGDLHGLDGIEWVHGNAERVDQPDGSFDFAISEYGAAIWCEPGVGSPKRTGSCVPVGSWCFSGTIRWSWCVHRWMVRCR